MSSPNHSIRQGLPRVAGGNPWPPAELFAGLQPSAPQASAEQLPAEPETVTPDPALAEPTPAKTMTTSSAPAAVAAAPAAGSHGALRQGLPRVVGGAPWPPAGTPADAAAPAAHIAAASTVAPAVPAPATPVAEPAPVIKSEVQAAEPAAISVTSADAPAVRRGLPRMAGGDPWPPSSFIAAPLAAAPAAAAAAQDPAPIESAGTPEPEATAAPAATEAPAEERPAAPAAQSAPATEAMAKPAADEAPAPVARTGMAAQKPVAAPSSAPAAKPAAKTKKEPVKHGPLTTKQWVLAGILAAFCALGFATAVVLVARGVADIDAVASFIERYPGEYHLPASAPVGIPAWLAWNHFFNFFLMVLIIRSGMLVRHQKKPPAYWSSKRSPKVSINLWLHQSLDLLWIINGVVFVVLLIATGHWMRIVPTSWEVFPNAFSAGLQYLTLDWPTENGWVNYNSLQQLAYFATIFIAAPLAAITGFRLSAYWPKNAAGLNKKYPIEAARAVHFPTMLYFVLFIVVHVVLVFTTGALRNLNHMYAAQGSTDPAAYADNWAGLLFFALSLLVIAGAWVACRPMILGSVARLFGKVSAR